MYMYHRYIHVCHFKVGMSIPMATVFTWPLVPTLSEAREATERVPLCAVFDNCSTCPQQRRWREKQPSWQAGRLALALNETKGRARQLPFQWAIDGRGRVGNPSHP